VTYASKHGSTQGIAEAIGDRLRERGWTPRCGRSSTSTARAVRPVVVGSAVYLGSWMKEALAFLDRHAEALGRIPVWLFSSGPTATDPMDRAVSVKTLRRLDAVGARDHHLFRGALVPKVWLLERSAVKAASSLRRLPGLERREALGGSIVVAAGEPT